MICIHRYFENGSTPGRSLATTIEETILKIKLPLIFAITGNLALGTTWEVTIFAITGNLALGMTWGVTIFLFMVFARLSALS